MTATYGEYLCTGKKLPDTSLYEELHGMGGKCYLVLASSESVNCGIWKWNVFDMDFSYVQFLFD